MAKILKPLRTVGKRIVFTNGCFDILHVGHVRYLNQARELGDLLVVGLNTDESVRVLKGVSRPVNIAEDRAEVLTALRAVDYVVLFGERTAEDLISSLQPDIYVKGGDYALADLPEAKAVSSYGGKTLILPLVPDRSTTRVLERIRGNE